jgi:serine O-acetyltransferase
MEDDIWTAIIQEAKQLEIQEPDLANFLQDTISNRSSFGDALASILANKVAVVGLSAPNLYGLFSKVLTNNIKIKNEACDDLKACLERDAACKYHLTPLLYFKGYQALQLQRIANWLWNQKRQELALFLQGRMADVFSLDIHPGAQFGSGIMIDHATGVVIGETSVVGNNVSILHGVTLGGNSTSRSKRHPTIGDGVLISAGAKILGNVEVGDGAKIGAGSLVLNNVPPHVTIAGVPASVVGAPTHEHPAFLMNQRFDM